MVLAQTLALAALDGHFFQLGRQLLLFNDKLLSATLHETNLRLVVTSTLLRSDLQLRLFVSKCCKLGFEFLGF
jgi:hypothetical protein